MILVLVFTGQSKEVSVQSMRRHFSYEGDADGLTLQQTRAGPSLSASNLTACTPHERIDVRW